jgi:hypothetical protein
MALYALRTRSTVTTTGAAAYEIRAASGARVEVREIGLFIGAATASTYGIGRPAAIGVTPTSPINVIAQDPAAPTGATTTAVAWGTGPTVPAQFLRAVALPAAIGNGIVWTFGPRELIIGQVAGSAAAVTSLVVWNLATNSAVLDIYFVVDE